MAPPKLSNAKLAKRTNTTLPSSLRNELEELGLVKKSKKQKQKDKQQQQLKGKGKGKGKEEKPKKDNKRKQPSPSPSPASNEEEAPPTKRTKQTPLEKLLAKQERKAGGSGVVDTKRPKSVAESNEDKEIAWLEAKLRMEKGAEDDDGLDDLFKDVDELESATFGNTTKDYSNLVPSDEDEDSEEEEMEEYGVSDEELDEPSDDDTAEEVDSEEEWGGVMEESENEDEVGLEDSEESSEEDSEEEEELNSEEEAEMMEDNWGNEEGDEEDESGNMVWTFDDAGNASSEPTPSTSTSTASKYVPPHLRPSAATSTPAAPTPTPTANAPPPPDPRLRRLLLSHLNKLSSSNLSTLLPLILSLYSSHPRAIVTSSLISLLVELIAVEDILGDGFLVVYAALVSGLGRELGGEVGAGVLVGLVNKFDELRDAGGNAEGAFEGKPGDKARENLVGFLSELYNFGVVACVVIYDLIRELIDIEGEKGQGMEESHVELLSKVVKRSGQQLRTDDPSALKEIINLVKQKMAGVDAASTSSRTKFMIETLTNLKNNKLKPLSSSTSDPYTPLKKYLTTLSKHKSAPEALRLTLNDIRTSSAKGKWWIVGAAWGGDPLVEARKKGLFEEKERGEEGENGELGQLAKKQGMNTDVRKSVFGVLMSSEDYVDACERLLQLGLTDIQQREIARVLLQCCGNEKLYNPYYTLVAQRMAQKSHSFQITLQYLLWDFFRELGEKKVGGQEMVKNLDEESGATSGKKVSGRRIGNLAKLYGWCVAKEALGLMILKPVPFVSLRPATTDFLRQLLTTLIIASQTPSPALSLKSTGTRRDTEALERAFVRIASNDQLVKGLAYFFETEMESDLLGKKDEKELAVLKWGIKVAKSTLEMGGGIVDLR